LDWTQMGQNGCKRARPDEIDSNRSDWARANSPDPRLPAPVSTSPAIEATAEPREGGVGFVSTGGIQRHPPRRPPSPVPRWRAWFVSGTEAELGGAGDATAVETKGSRRLTWAWRLCRGRAAAREAATAEFQFEAARGGRSGGDGATVVGRARRRRGWIPGGAAELAGAVAVENGAKQQNAAATGRCRRRGVRQRRRTQRSTYRAKLARSRPRVRRAGASPSRFG
jgi:hypothetical protein